MQLPRSMESRSGELKIRKLSKLPIRSRVVLASMIPKATQNREDAMVQIMYEVMREREITVVAVVLDGDHDLRDNLLPSIEYVTVQLDVHYAAQVNPQACATTLETYKAQRQTVDAAISGFIDLLRSEGWNVTDDSGGVSGSGEWRTRVALTCAKPGTPELICYVEGHGLRFP